ncbi:hypothetical protein F4604DRAFT_1927195 [Suillus subluteus]|nr:hypothetical protein F4604DRAFT_1927195 [Suillus subluteus]
MLLLLSVLKNMIFTDEYWINRLSSEWLAHATPMATDDIDVDPTIVKLDRNHELSCTEIHNEKVYDLLAEAAEDMSQSQIPHFNTSAQLAALAEVLSILWVSTITVTYFLPSAQTEDSPSMDLSPFLCVQPDDLHQVSHVRV